MHDVRIDLDQGVIDSVLAGFLTPDEVGDYVRRVQTALIMNQFHRGYCLIIDVSECAIQSQATLAAFQQHMVAMPKARRIAVVVGKTPGTGQVRRLFTQAHARLVETREEGLAWIASGVEPRLHVVR